MRSIVTVVLLTVALACEAPAPAPVQAPTARELAPPVAVQTPDKAPALAPPPAPAEAPLAGVGPGGAEGRAPRRQAVLDLLSDGRSAGALELVAANPDHPFDDGLAERLSPKTIVHGVPEVAQRAHSLDGPLDKEIVRRIVRAHINEVRYCYNQGLAEDDGLAGRVTIDFEILPGGSVSTAVVGKSTLPDPAVNACIATAARRWKFPSAAAVTKVSYPFELSPAG